MSHTPGRRRPLADAVEREDRCFLERTRKEDITRPAPGAGLCLVVGRRAVGIALGEAEGLNAHARSVSIRLNQK
jgi:hypothetical protein